MRWKVLLAVVCVTATVVRATAAETPSPVIEEDRWAEIDKLTADFVDRSAECAGLSEQAEFYKRQSSRFAGSSGALARMTLLIEALRSSDAEGKQAIDRLAEMVRENGKAVLDELKEAAQSCDEQEKECRAAWTKVRTDLNRSKLDLLEVEASGQSVDQFAYLLSVDNRWFWLGAVLVIAALAGVELHERRYEVRRLLVGKRARSLGGPAVVLVILTLVVVVMVGVFCCGDRIYQSLLHWRAPGKSPLASIRQDGANLEKKIANVGKQVAQNKEEYDRKLEAWRESIPDASSLDPELLELYSQFLDRVRLLAANAATRKELCRRTQEDWEELGKVKDALNAKAGQIAARQRKRERIRIAAAFVFFALALGGAGLFLRGVRRRAEKTANTCPLCLGVNTLEPVGNQDGGPRLLRCDNTGEAFERGVCEFTFSETYRSLPKLCFPTLGIPQTGKTHWLAMTYRQINCTDYPPNMRIDRLRWGLAEQFDAIVDEILNARMGPMPTLPAIPTPLVFDFHAQDCFGAPTPW